MEQRAELKEVKAAASTEDRGKEIRRSAAEEACFVIVFFFNLFLAN